MLIESATGDPRVGESKALAARARSNGVDARLELYPVAAHAFQLFWSFLPEAADAMESAGAFLRLGRSIESANGGALDPSGEEQG